MVRRKVVDKKQDSSIPAAAVCPALTTTPKQTGKQATGGKSKSSNEPKAKVRFKHDTRRVLEPFTTV